MAAKSGFMRLLCPNGADASTRKQKARGANPGPPAAAKRRRCRRRLLQKPYWLRLLRDVRAVLALPWLAWPAWALCWLFRRWRLTEPLPDADPLPDAEALVEFSAPLAVPLALPAALPAVPLA
jgi:hypothetical protein